MILKTGRTLGAIFIALLLSGCVGVALEGVGVAKDEYNRHDNMEAADAGDAEAQYKVGKSYCCQLQDKTTAIYDNDKATEYLCMSARQDYAPAALEMGNIYSGDVVSGLRLLRRAANLVRSHQFDDEQIAYYWYQQAAANGNADAQKALKKLDEQDISEFSDPATTPCTLEEVFGKSKDQ